MLRGEPDAPSLDRVDVVQPALWAVMVSLAALWRAHGVHPAAVLGQSQGEVAAACVAGALSLEDGARVVAVRSALIQQHLSGRGGLASVSLPAGEVADRLRTFDPAGTLSIGAVNGPATVVVSGPAERVDELVAAWEEARRITVDYASHSAEVGLIEEPLTGALAGIRPRTADVPFYSTVAGEVVDTATLDGGYWFRNLRRTVQLERALGAAAADGLSAFVECSPHPVLVGAVQDCVQHAGLVPATVGTLRRDEGGMRRFLLSLAAVHAQGRDVDWSMLVPGARRVRLPSYAFQRERYWLDGVPAAAIPEAVEPVSSDAGQREDVARLVRAETAAVLGVPDPAGSTWRFRSRNWASTRRWPSSWWCGSTPRPACGCPAPRCSPTRPPSCSPTTWCRPSSASRETTRSPATRPSRSRSSAWAAAIRAAWRHPRTCGAC